MFTVMGIDPGISFLGAGALSINTKKPEPFKLIYADTLSGELNDFMVREDTPNQTKAKGLIRAYGYLLDYIEPHAICCEDNFLQMSPSSFKRLIEIVTMMSYCTLTSRPEIPFHLVLPRLTKQIVNVDFQGSTKDDVRHALMKSPLLDLNGIDLTKLTEHANDSILIALYEAVQIYKTYGWINKDEETKIYTIKT